MGGGQGVLAVGSAARDRPGVCGQSRAVAEQGRSDPVVSCGRSSPLGPPLPHGEDLRDESGELKPEFGLGLADGHVTLSLIHISEPTRPKR